MTVTSLSTSERKTCYHYLKFSIDLFSGDETFEFTFLQCQDIFPTPSVSVLVYFELMNQLDLFLLAPIFYIFYFISISYLTMLQS